MKIKQIFFIILICIGFLACNSDEKQAVETISMEELLGDSEFESEENDTLTSSIDSRTAETSNLLNLIQVVNPGYDTNALSVAHPMDRYGFSSKSKIKFVGKTDVPYGKTNMVTPKAEFYVYNFPDSIKLNNAFYNWLDCFGSDCDEIKLNQDVEYVKTPPSFTLIYDTVLVDVKYLCEHEKNDWKSFQKSIINTYGKNYRYRIDVNCGGPLKWK